MQIKSTVHLANYIYSCIDLTEYPEGSTLKEIILTEKGVQVLTDRVVEDWLRGLPTACTIPFMDHEIQILLDKSGNSHWTIDGYWRWCASRVKSFALFPAIYA